MGDSDQPYDIRWLQTDDHDAEAEVMNLPKRGRDRALKAMERFAQLSRTQFRIKPTYVGKIFEAKFDIPEGGLRVLFVHGSTRNVLWCIGAFIKPDEKKGNRQLESYRALSEIAESR